MRDNQRPPRRARLTKRAIDAFPVLERDYEVSDIELTGFAVRVYANGTRSAVVRYRVGDRQRRMSLGRLGPAFTVHQARQRALEVLGTVRAGEDPSGERRQRRGAVRLREVAERYMAEHVASYCKRSTAAWYRGMLDKHALPELGAMRLEEITRTDVERLHRKVGRRSPTAANRTISMLRAVFNAAARWDCCPGSFNPCQGIRLFRERKVERFLTTDERRRLEHALRRSVARRSGRAVIPTAADIGVMMRNGAHGLSRRIGSPSEQPEHHRAHLRRAGDHRRSQRPVLRVSS